MAEHKETKAVNTSINKFHFENGGDTFNRAKIKRKTENNVGR